MLLVACGAPTAPAPIASGSALVTPASGTAEQAKRAQIAEQVTWAPGQLEAHFSKHGREGPYATQADFDRAAREVIVIGTAFTYIDRESRATRLGYYHAPSNRFTSLSSDARRITTFFHPDQRDRYVRNLDRSTYQ